SFSQYSTSYHRLMLESYALAESWRRFYALPPFSARLQGRLRAATLWLHALCDPLTGDAPNLGANDGARLIGLGGEAYRDFRPAVQPAALLFAKARAYAPAGPWDQPAHWLGLAPAEAVLAAPASQSFDHGGLHLLCAGAARAYLRYPRF